jgi:hypothetical protein
MEKKKKQLTEKQLANLAAGRASRAEKLKVKENIPVVEAVVSPPVQSDTPVAEVSELPKVKKLGGRVWWQVIVGIVFFVLTGIIGIAYTKNMTNSFLAFGFVVSGGIGILFTYMGLRKRDEGIQLRAGSSGKQKSYIANSMNIYYGYDEGTKKYYCDYIAFEQLEKGDIKAKHPQQCLDTGKWYYVHMYDPIRKELRPFVLPDKQYYSPVEFVNPLTMPASKKVLKPKQKLGEKLRPVLLLIALGIMVFAFVITAPTPAAAIPPATSSVQIITEVSNA